jgi:hypothetical protein
VPLPIRTNLAGFLRQAVPTTTPDFTPPPQTTLLPGPEVDLLWIDALCINQADTAERNAQVQRMGALYARADRVLAWLGAEDDDSDLAMDAMRDLSLSALRADDAPLAAEVARQMADGECLGGIVRLVQREYWRRAWYVWVIPLYPLSPFSFARDSEVIVAAGCRDRQQLSLALLPAGLQPPSFAWSMENQLTGPKPTY